MQWRGAVFPIVDVAIIPDRVGVIGHDAIKEPLDISKTDIDMDAVDQGPVGLQVQRTALLFQLRRQVLFQQADVVFTKHANGQITAAAQDPVVGRVTVFHGENISGG